MKQLCALQCFVSVWPLWLGACVLYSCVSTHVLAWFMATFSAHYRPLHHSALYRLCVMKYCFLNSGSSCPGLSWWDRFSEVWLNCCIVNLECADSWGLFYIPGIFFYLLNFLLFSSDFASALGVGVCMVFGLCGRFCPYFISWGIT